MSVMHSLTRSSIRPTVSWVSGLVPRSTVSLLLGFSAMLRVSLVSRVTARSLHHICVCVYRHLVSGHEISRLQHCLECIMLVALA